MEQALLQFEPRPGDGTPARTDLARRARLLAWSGIGWHDTIPDDRKAVSEARRVLRPGGRLVLLEHVCSPVLAVRALQRALDPLAVRFEADHLVRDPLDYLADERFDVASVQRSKWGIVERVLARKSG